MSLRYTNIDYCPIGVTGPAEGHFTNLTATNFSPVAGGFYQQAVYSSSQSSTGTCTFTYTTPSTITQANQFQVTAVVNTSTIGLLGSIAPSISFTSAPTVTTSGSLIVNRAGLLALATTITTTGQSNVIPFTFSTLPSSTVTVTFTGTNATYSVYLVISQLN